MKHHHIVIMAGGIGSRFWPMSTPTYPKQFIDVMGVGKSLIQLTVDRFGGICPPENFWVVTSEAYKDIVRKQLPDIPEQHILTEPEARNTAPCIAYASWKIRQQDAEANIVVTPSDALICAGEKLEGSEIHRVDSFREKPNLETAQQYLDAGNYLWNAGIFVWNVNTITAALRMYAPQIAGVMAEELKRLFPTCEKISIDYAVMEKAKSIYVLPADFGWSDLGSWGSLHTLLTPDERQNTKVGNDIRMFDCRNCIVHTQDEKQVVIEGLDGYIVAEKDGRLLVCRLKNEQLIKEFAKS